MTGSLGQASKQLASCAVNVRDPPTLIGSQHKKVSLQERRRDAKFYEAVSCSSFCVYMRLFLLLMTTDEESKINSARLLKTQHIPATVGRVPIGKHTIHSYMYRWVPVNPNMDNPNSRTT